MSLEIDIFKKICGDKVSGYPNLANDNSEPKMATFRVCYLNKPYEDGSAPYETYVDFQYGTSLDEVWGNIHNNYDLGSVVNIMDMEQWIDKTFYK